MASSSRGMPQDSVGNGVTITRYRCGWGTATNMIHKGFCGPTGRNAGHGQEWLLKGAS